MYDGSAAYDLERQGWYEFQPQQEDSRPEPVRKAKPAAKRQPAYSVSLSAFAGIAAAVVLVVFVLLAYINYTDVSAATVQLEERLAELVEEERHLTVRYEETFDITEIEAYATGVLGMSKPADDQIVNLGLTAEDKAVVLSEDVSAVSEASASIGGFVDFFTSLAAYFK